MATTVLLGAAQNFENAVDVRNAAAHALALVANPGAASELRAVALKYPEISTRRVLLEACERQELKKPNEKSFVSH